MTLIATLRIHGVPVLLGDLLISGGQREGTRRKVSLLRSNLAIAWTGRRIDAELFFRELHRVLPEVVCEQSLRSGLHVAAQITAPMRSLEVLGWLLAEEATPFSWTAQLPARLLVGQLAARGSGRSVLERRLPNLRVTSDHSRSTQSPFEQAAVDALYDAGQLLTSEFGRRDLRRDSRIGAGYEILIQDGDRFRYASPTVYAAISISVDSSGEVLSIDPPHGIVLSRMIGEYNLQQSWYRSHNEEGQIDINLTQPIVDTDTRLLARLNRRLSVQRLPLYFRGNFLVVLIQAISDGVPWPPCAYIESEQSDRWSGTRQGITFNLEYIRMLARTVAADLQRRS